MQFNSSQSFSCYLWYHNSHYSRLGAFPQKFYSNAASSVFRDESQKTRNAFRD